MKNKLNYILFVLYFFIVGFILYINGVFTGNISSYSNLIINIGFLLLIGILFIISAASFSKLHRCTWALVNVTGLIKKEYAEKNQNLWSVYKGKKNIFENEMLDDAFSRYQKYIAAYETKKGLLKTCDLEVYINEDLLDQAGSSHFNSSLSGTLTGLGILGTFIGLSLGLGAFSGDDIYTISDNVGPLLSGMKVAFHTSVYGIFFSLIFNFIYRSIMAAAYAELSEFLSCFRECVMPDVVNADETAQVMLVYQANMANSLKAILDYMKGNALEQTQGMEHIVEEFSRQLSHTMGTDFAKLGKTLKDACDAQTTYAHNYQSMEQTAKELLETNRIMQQSLEHTINWQEMFAREIKKQQEKLTHTCDTLSEDIGNQLYTFNQMRDLYEK